MTIRRLPSCDDPREGGLLPVDIARARLDAVLDAVAETETIPTAELFGRVLAVDIRAGFDVPSHDNSAMDGYALHRDSIPADGDATLDVIGTAWAGRPFDNRVESGQAVRIFTGAIMPDGCDTVVIQEHVIADGNRIRIDERVSPGRNVRRAGEDLTSGAIVLAAGTRVGAAEMGMIASLGRAAVETYRRVRVAFFTTGDEIRTLEAHAGEILPNGVLFDSNRYSLLGLLQGLGVEIIDLGAVADDQAATEAVLREAATKADCIVSSGGVSAGDADHVSAALAATGEIAFWKLAMRPGRPLAVGRIADAVCFGLPGNPVAVLVTFLQFVQPAIRRLAGQREVYAPEVVARCDSALRKSPGRTEYQRGVASVNANGELVVVSTGKQGAGRLSSVSQANCLIVLQPELETVEPGTRVRVQLFRGLLP